jgi:hypothetical protein
LKDKEHTSAGSGTDNDSSTSSTAERHVHSSATPIKSEIGIIQNEPMEVYDDERQATRIVKDETTDVLDDESFEVELELRLATARREEAELQSKLHRSKRLKRE